MCLNEYVNWGGVFVSSLEQKWCTLQNPWAVCDNGHLRRQSIGAFIIRAILRVNTELVCRRVKLCWDFRRLRLNVLRIGGTGWHPCVLFAHFRQVGVRGDVTSPRSHKKPEIPLLSSGDPINPLGAILGVDCAKRLHFRNRFLRAPNRCDE